MAEYKYYYISTAHSQAGIGAVAIRLQREDGGSFEAILSTDDAERLLADLPEQVRIAKHHAANRA